MAKINKNSLKPTARDIAINATRGLITGNIPFIGGMLDSLLSDFIPLEVNKRRDELLLSLDESFKELEDEINEDTIKTSEFASLFIEAFRASVSTDKQEKLNAFKAILLNCLTKQNPNFDEYEVITRIVTNLTSLHIKLMKLFHNPTKFLSENNDASMRYGSPSMTSSLSQLTMACFSEYSEDIITSTVKDLENMGIGNGVSTGFSAMVTATGPLQPKLTEFGNKVVLYITFPS